MQFARTVIQVSTCLIPLFCLGAFAPRFNSELPDQNMTAAITCIGLAIGFSVMPWTLASVVSEDTQKATLLLSGSNMALATIAFLALLLLTFFKTTCAVMAQQLGLNIDIQKVKMMADFLAVFCAVTAGIESKRGIDRFTKVLAQISAAQSKPTI